MEVTTSSSEHVSKGLEGADGERDDSDEIRQHLSPKP